MSIRLGSQVIGGISREVKYNAHNLLDFKWSDRKLYDVSWINAMNFSWQNGELYQGAYQHLVADLESVPVVPTETYYAWKNYNNVKLYTKTTSPTTSTQLYEKSGSNFVESTGTIDYTDSSAIYVTYRGELEVEFSRDASSDESFGNAQTETIAGITIEYITAQDGHKIVLPTQETAVEQIYQATGVAWYYIVDTTNQRFKLPRTKYSFTGIRDGVGNYVPESLPNIRGNDGYKMDGNVQLSGSFYLDNTIKYRLTNAGGGSTSTGTGFDASLSSSTYQDNAPVQQRATQMYLYFYVGEYSRSAVEQTAGLNAEMFNQKADKSEVWTPTSTTQTQKETIVGWGMPDYESSVSVTSGFICPYDGVVRAYAYDNGVVDYDLKNEDNTVVGHASASASTSQNNVCYVFVFKGYTLSQKRKSGNSLITFYPLKGVSNA